jgi:hypothetical protein
MLTKLAASELNLRLERARPGALYSSGLALPFRVIAPRIPICY